MTINYGQPKDTDNVGHKTINNGQPKDTDNVGHKTQEKDKQNKKDTREKN